MCRGVPCCAALPEADSLFSMFASATARTRATLEKQTPEHLAAIRAGMADNVATKFHGAFYNNANMATSYFMMDDSEHFFAGADETLIEANGAPAKTSTAVGRMPYMVPMPCIVGSARKP